jgi:hypothetical protein
MGNGKAIWVWRGLGIAALIIAGILLLGYITQYLWNWLMPELFHLPEIDYFKALGLVMLSKILFGGIRFNAHGNWRKRKQMQAMLEARMADMTEEERTAFKQQFAERCRKKWGAHEPQQSVDR